MKILVFCSDVVPLPNLPTTGGGLRSWQWIESLRRLGHDVIASLPLFTYLSRRYADVIPSDAKANAWTPETQDELVARLRPDAIVFASSWTTYHLRRPVDAWRIGDCNGPVLLEALYQRPHDVAALVERKVNALAQMDFLGCASLRQKSYLTSFLLLARYELEEIGGVAVVPPAFSPELPRPEPPDSVELVAGGGFYPWQDPRPGLYGVADVLATIRLPARLRIFGGSHHVTGRDEALYQDIRATLKPNPRIEFHDFLSWSELTEVLRTASVAVDVHVRHPERELAVSTRALDAMRCGLPVVLADYAELATAVQDYDAGWIVDAADPEGLRRVVADIIASPAECAAKGRRAQLLIRDRYTYDRAIMPVQAFLQQPRRRRIASGSMNRWAFLRHRRAKVLRRLVSVLRPRL